MPGGGKVIAKLQESLQHTQPSQSLSAPAGFPSCAVGFSMVRDREGAHGWILPALYEAWGSMGTRWRWLLTAGQGLKVSAKTRNNHRMEGK